MRRMDLALSIASRLDAHATLEDVTVNGDAGRVEYRHTTADEELLGPSILGSVAAIAQSLGELTHPPQRTDVVAHSPDDEPPLKFHVTKAEARRAEALDPDAPADAHRSFIADVIADAERFIEVET